MGWSLTLFRVRGIDVKVHWSFVLILVFAAFSYGAANDGSTLGALYGVISILLLFVCVTLHEFGHALMAQYFKVKVPNITLLPIGGVASLERMPDKPFQEFLIAIAGPLVNFALASLLLPLWLMVHALDVQQGLAAPLGLNPIVWFERMWTQMQTPGLGNLLAYLVEMNITLALFNLLPAFPMDGGRILRSILATAMPYIQATRFSVFVGRIIAVILAIWGLTGGGVLLLLIAFFIYVGGGSEQESIESRAILRDIPIAQALTPGAISLYTSERAKRAVDLIMTSYQTDYPVLDLAGQFVGVLTRARLILALREVGEEARIVEIMTPAESVPNFSLDGTLSDIWEKMVQSGSRVVAVREGNQFRGLITIDDVTELIQVMGANFDRNLQKPPSSSASNNQPSPASGETANA